MNVPQVAFYILPEDHESARLNFVCRLAEKAYRQNLRVYIHTASQAAAHQIDERLWTYRDDSFLPHNLIDENHTPAPPIQIGFAEKPKVQHAILINLSDTVPDFYQGYQRIFEIINQDETQRALGRERYRQYQQSQCPLTTHTM